ncbi:DUF6588 family protein [Tenacibaculum agarivorans]|uniref:DUF6588 family protein n=1 Tax=Tenacibaculum agarivorans TaxID=1908389 RepID=UPI00373FD7DB
MLLSLFMVSTMSSFSQDVETILLARDDAQKLMNAYLDPSFKGFVYSMNNGWYHTAKVHKKFGFDISIGGNFSFIPDADKVFDISTIGLSNATSSDRNTTPTVAGGTDQRATVTYTTTVQGQNVSADFLMPEGVGDDVPFNAVPAPSLQASVGLPFKLDVMLRFVPKVGSDNVKGGLFGVGLKKEITDWFGVVDKTPLHISLLAAYTNMNVDYDIEDATGDVATNNGAIEFDLNSYTVQAIASLNLPVINFFGGVGYNGGSTSLNVLGEYVLTYETTTTPSVAITETVTNPFSLSSSTGSFNATVGTRLSLGFFKIYGSYTLQEYGSLNAGIAFSFR